jgi:predicted phosphodiesterase
MHRTALISDIHGNAIALRATLEDIRRRGVDRIVCLGDVATLGPSPRECAQLVAEHAEQTVLGNHDDYVLDPCIADAHNAVPMLREAIAWARQELGAEGSALLRRYTPTVDVEVGVGLRLLGCHGSPRSYVEDLLAQTDVAQLDAAIGPTPADIIAAGHTHVQMLRQHRGRWLINPGSVGMPFRAFVAAGPPEVMGHAEYAMLESGPGGLACALHRVELDASALHAAAAAWDIPFGRSLCAQYARAIEGV